MADSDLPNFGNQNNNKKYSKNDMFSSISDVEDDDEEDINKYLLINSKKNKIDHEKNIQNKLSKLYMRMRYAQHKYHDIRRHFTHRNRLLCQYLLYLHCWKLLGGIRI